MAIIVALTRSAPASDAGCVVLLEHLIGVPWLYE